MFSAYKLVFVWFLSLFSEGLMCMRQNFKLFCCAAYRPYFEFDCLNLSVLLAEFVVFGRIFSEFRSFRKNSAEPDISRKYGSASRIF